MRAVSLINLLAVAVSAAALTGCVISAPASPNDPHYAPVIISAQEPTVSSNGSLFRDTSGMDLYTDRKARGVGDLITVILQENTVSQKSSRVGMSKESEISIPEAAGAAGTLLGRAVGMGGLSLGTQIGGDRQFNGEADANQRNNLRGNIAVSVVEVWPNGTLVVRGEKWMTLSSGDEFIRVSGLIRPDDIAPDNTVLSTRLANARISYSGTGALANSGNMGWLSRFFNSSYWPF